MDICWVEPTAPTLSMQSPARWAWLCYSCASTDTGFTDQAAAELAAADHCWAVASASLAARGHSPVPQWRDLVTDPVLRGCDLDLVVLLLTVAGFYVPDRRITPLSAQELQALVGRCQLRGTADGSADSPGARRRGSLVLETALEEAGLELAVWHDAVRLPADRELPALVAALRDAGLLAPLSPPRTSV